MKVIINTNNVVGETEKGLLLSMPKSSKYNGFKTWIPKSLADKGLSYVHFGCWDSWTFKLTRKCETITISAEEFAEAFKSSHPQNGKRSFFEAIEPEKIIISKVEIPECLKNSN
jgi:hypothetical protein